MKVFLYKGYLSLLVLLGFFCSIFAKDSFCTGKDAELDPCYDPLIDVTAPLGRYCEIYPKLLHDFARCTLAVCDLDCLASESKFNSLYENMQESINNEIEGLGLDQCVITFPGCEAVFQTYSPTMHPTVGEDSGEENFGNTFSPTEEGFNDYYYEPDAKPAEDIDNKDSKNTKKKRVKTGLVLGGIAVVGVVGAVLIAIKQKP